MSETYNFSNIISEGKENKNINSNITNSDIEQIIDVPTQLTKKYNANELKYFKDDIMNYFKQKFEEYSTKLNENIIKISKIEKNFEEMTENINTNYNKIIKTQATMQSELDKLKNYDSFSKNVKDKLISHEVRLNNVREDLTKATQKYDKIYLDNLELPGFIGRCAKYKNCQIFFEDVIKNLATLNLFREKNIIDLKSYKEKLENIIKSFHILVDNNNQSHLKYINSQNEKNITDCKNMMKILEEKIRDVKVDNAKYSMDIMKKTEEMHKKWDKIDKIKEEIFSEFNIKNDELKKLNDDTIEKFNEFKKEYKIIRDKFFELADFIKDIRFQKNIKNIYSQILYRKNIKSICKSLSELNDIKNNNNDDTDLELIKNISTIEKMNFKINKNNAFEQNLSISQEIPNNNNNDNSKNKKNLIKKAVEYNSPFKINKISRNEKISLNKSNKTIDAQKQNINREIKNYTMYNFSNNNKIDNDIVIYKEKEECKNHLNNSNYIKKKGNQKIIIESKFDTSLLSTNKTLKKSSANEESNSLVFDNQSTNYINSNNINKNENNKDISFSTVSAFSLNYENNNNNNNYNNIKKLENNDKTIKELASELEQSTAKKDIYITNTKETQDKIEPKNLTKTNYDTKDNLISSNSINNCNANKNIIGNTNNNRNIHNLQNEIKSASIMSNKEKNELILYGNSPKAIDKKFFMTDKKLLDLEEYTKDKLTEIINQIDKIKMNNMENSNNNGVQLKTNKSSNILSFNSYKDKASSLSNNTLNIKNEKKTNSSFMNNISNKIKYLSQKINENKSARKNYENYKKDLDLNSHNFKKRKFYNLEHINQKIINSSCKKIKTNSNDDKEKKMMSPRAKEYITKTYLSRNDINALEQKKSENNFFNEGKKWETIDNIKIKNIDNKKQKNKNSISGNIYLTQKNGDNNNSINENDIKLVYLNKFVNNKLPFAPSDTFLGEKN